jgi:hypothetical protein
MILPPRGGAAGLRSRKACECCRQLRPRAPLEGASPRGLDGLFFTGVAWSPKFENLSVQGGGASFENGSASRVLLSLSTARSRGLRRSTKFLEHRLTQTQTVGRLGAACEEIRRRPSEPSQPGAQNTGRAFGAGRSGKRHEFMGREGGALAQGGPHESRECFFLPSRTHRSLFVLLERCVTAAHLCAPEGRQPARFWSVRVSFENGSAPRKYFGSQSALRKSSIDPRFRGGLRSVEAPKWSIPEDSQGSEGSGDGGPGPRDRREYWFRTFRRMMGNVPVAPPLMQNPHPTQRPE